MRKVLWRVFCLEKTDELQKGCEDISLAAVSVQERILGLGIGVARVACPSPGVALRVTWLLPDLSARADKSVTKISLWLRRTLGVTG